MRGILSVVFIGLALGGSATARQAKVVKSASDRVCVKKNGKLHCEPKKAKHRARNMSAEQVGTVDKLDAKVQSEDIGGAGADTKAEGAN